MKRGIVVASSRRNKQQQQQTFLHYESELKKAEELLHNQKNSNNNSNNNKKNNNNNSNKHALKTSVEQKRVSEMLQQQQQHSTCLACLENIQGAQSIWQCRQCFVVVHLSCIQSWAVASRQQQRPSSLSVNAFPSLISSWLCPNCRMTINDFPRSYFCWCGKVQDPPFDLWSTPHACGDPCGKPLAEDCSHTCILLCHPGPCPPCPQTVQSRCFCGKNSTTRRCGDRYWSCHDVCGGLLHCSKNHTCKELCHAGPHPPCSKSIVRSCICGKNTTSVPCNQKQAFVCDTVCTQLLPCGNHTCGRVCHPPGECGVCSLQGIRSCHCGKKKFDLSCTNPTPSCGDTCGKELSCKIHSCQRRCHPGECDECYQLVKKRCRCGATTKEVPCETLFLCEKRCGRTKSCTNHVCKRRCCGNTCLPCEEICAKKLFCKNHICNSPCHAGPCRICPLSVSLSCACFQTKIVLPCGAERYTQPPSCKFPCTIPPTCHHTSREYHLCHFSDCPPCNQICGIVHKDCHHPCSLPCHDPLPDKPTLTKKQKKDPYYRPPLPSPLSEVQVVCPPCLVPVPRFCLGKHQEEHVPCSSLPWSCKRKCGNLLNCGVHKCELECHIITKRKVLSNDGVSVIVTDSYSDDTCELCTLPCKIPRPSYCRHTCKLSCHPPSLSCPKCTVKLRIQCHCSSTKVTLECWQQEYLSKDSNLLSCGQRCYKNLPRCTHSCTRICHPGTCFADCSKKVRVYCRCKTRKEQWSCNRAQQERGSHPPGFVTLLQCAELCENIQHQLKNRSSPIIEQTNKEEPDVAKRTRRKKRKQVAKNSHYSLWLNKFIRFSRGFRVCFAVVLLLFALFLFWYWASSFHKY